MYLAGVEVSTGFTTVLNPDQETTPGGSVTFDVAPADLININLVRVVELSQNVDYQPFDAFPSETHEGALDRLTMQVQQLQEQLDRGILPPPDIPPGEDVIIPGNLTVQGNSNFVGDASGSNSPTLVAHLTRMDYVDGAVGAAVVLANAAQATADAAKPNVDFLRTGDRLDINNVPT